MSVSDDDDPRHAARPSRRRTWLKRVAIGVALLLVVLTTGAVVVYKRLEGNINGIDADFGTAQRPTEVKVEGPSQPITVLVIGSDSREGTDIGGDTPGLSDTTMLLHVSADRSRAFGISLPRDLMVDRPECTKNGQTVPGGLTQFNAAYAVGGPVCTVRTVEAMTENKVKIDHFVVVDLAGFKNMVDAVGGVQVCVPKEVNDTTGNIYLPEGTYRVTGNRALDYMRVRHDLGLANGDIGRMKRQQAFIASMVDKVMSAGTLTNPARLIRFLDAATKSLTTDEDFANLRKLASLGSSLADIGTSNIRFLTVPNEAYEPDPNRLQLAPEAQQLFRKIRMDQPLGRFSEDALAPGESPGAVPSESPSQDPSGSPSSSPSGSPSASPETDEELAARRAEAEERRRQAAEDAGLCV